MRNAAAASAPGGLKRCPTPRTAPQGRDANKKLQRALRAQKMRDKLPAMVAAVRRGLGEWKEAEGVPFLYDGRDYDVRGGVQRTGCLQRARGLLSSARLQAAHDAAAVGDAIALLRHPATLTAGTATAAAPCLRPCWMTWSSAWTSWRRRRRQRPPHAASRSRPGPARRRRARRRGPAPRRGRRCPRASPRGSCRSATRSRWWSGEPRPWGAGGAVLGQVGMGRG